MTQFSYTAYDPIKRKRHIGHLEADTNATAIKQIRARGLMPLSLGEGHGLLPKQHGHKVPLKEKIIFTRQLAVMIRAGLPLVKALDALAKQTNSKNFKKVITEVSTATRGGQTLSSAMEHYPKVFPEVYVAVIRAGEQTGQLAEVLLHLADQQEKQADLIGKVKGAMMYPAIILLALIGVVVLIIFFVLPSLKNIFADYGATLPLTTRLLFGISDAVRHYYYFVLGGLAVLYYGVILFGKTETGQHLLDRIKISFPIFGNLTKKVYMASFARTMGMLVHSSLPIIQSLKIVQKTINNSLYQAAFDRISLKVESGKSLSAAVSDEKIFPPMVSQLITLGEDSGNLEGVLGEITRFYDSEVDAMTKNMASLIEPMMLIMMGIGVAFVVTSVLSPIYKLVNQF